MLDYEPVWRAMQRFTDTREPGEADQIWLLEHPSVFTLGQAGRAEHVLAAGDIPLLQVDRGGQVTWHGPGQCVAYLMLDLRRLGLGVRELVDRIEAALIGVLREFGIAAAARRDAPGVLWTIRSSTEYSSLRSKSPSARRPSAMLKRQV